MEFSIKSGSPEKQRTGCVVVGVFEGRKLSASAQAIDKASRGFLTEVLRRGDHEGKAGTSLLLHCLAGLPSDRVLLVGLGKERELGESGYRKAVDTAIRALRSTGTTEATLLEQSKRWHEQEAIRADIVRAFSGVTLGNGVGLTQAQGIDGYESEACCAGYREHDEKQDWRLIPVEQLNECSSSLSFFDAEGMRFHLPAYLIADLNGQYPFGMAFVLTQSSGRDSQFVLLNPEQHAAVRRYLKFILDEPEYAFDRADIERALATHWLE